jgi:ankyrin repeat protein
VKLLLERTDVNPEMADCWGRSPLSLAAENGHERVVKILLEQEGVGPNTVDIKYGQTPLSWAAEKGHEAVVEMLLKRDDVNPELADKYGRTSLSWATQNGHEGVVKLLLERRGSSLNPQADISTDLISNGSSELPEPPSKRIRKA